MRIRTLLFFSLLIPIQVMAGTVVFTDAQHPPLNLTAETEVVWLDGPDRLQQAIFSGLSSDSQQAALQAQQVIQSSEWPQKQAQIASAYRQVVHAWEIGVQKYPAVVFDDRDVVYGTADVAQANLHRTPRAD